jgi:TM2 domain-containing membrane protein YozV
LTPWVFRLPLHPLGLVVRLLLVNSPNRVGMGLIALILPFLGLGWIGLHKFLMGYTREGIIHILISVVTCGIGGTVISFVEGIIYLTKSDSEFYNDYVVRRRGWF